MYTGSAKLIGNLNDFMAMNTRRTEVRYNSYLIKEEKTALIDTVWGPYSKEFVENLARETDLGKIDYVIANHAEPDHSGALPVLMSKIPERRYIARKTGLNP